MLEGSIVVRVTSPTTTRHIIECIPVQVASLGSRQPHDGTSDSLPYARLSDDQIAQQVAAFVEQKITTA